MEKKTTKVATVENNVTTIKIDNTPTGKVKTIKDKEAIKKAREEQYKNFRIAALKRRAKRMKLSEEETKKKIEELLVQLDTPNSYSVLILFSPKDENLVVQALKNEDLTWKMKSNSHLFIDADQETLATLRSIMPPTAKIHPYVKKKPPVIPAKNVQKEDKKPSNNKGTTKFHQKHWKRPNVASLSKVKRKEFKKRVKSLRDKWKAQKASKKASGTVVQLNSKKGSKSSKKASTNLKQAA